MCIRDRSTAVGTGATRPCTSCSAEVPVSFKFCGACGTSLADAPAPAAPKAEAPAPSPQATLTLIRPDGSEGGTHALSAGENQIGRKHGTLFENDGYLSPDHAILSVNGKEAVIRDNSSLNGVFVRIANEEKLVSGSVLRIGQELIRFESIVPPVPGPDGTEVMGSPNPGYWGKLVILIGQNIDGAAYPLLGDSVSLGRERGDINFPDDGYVSGLHARLIHRDGDVFLADAGSSNGTFLKLTAERTVSTDSFVLLGQQLFRLSL